MACIIMTTPPRAYTPRAFNRYGAAASTPPGRPPPVGTGGTPVPIDWVEEQRIRARQRQRRLHMLAQEDRANSSAGTGEGRTPSRERTTGGTVGGGGDGSRGEGGGARERSRVPWHLLDELDAEKTKLRVS